MVVAGLLLSSMNLWLLSCLITRWKTMGGRGAWLVVGALGFQTLVFALRIGLVGISSWVGAELMQSSAVQTLTFMSTFAVVLVASMGFVFMAATGQMKTTAAWPPWIHSLAWPTGAR